MRQRASAIASLIVVGVLAAAGCDSSGGGQPDTSDSDLFEGDGQVVTTDTATSVADVADTEGDGGESTSTDTATTDTVVADTHVAQDTSADLVETCQAVPGSNCNPNRQIQRCCSTAAGCYFKFADGTQMPCGPPPTSSCPANQSAAIAYCQGGTCSGSVKSCYYASANQSQCTGISGCYYEAANCSGYAKSCSQFNGNSYNCNHQPGCSYYSSNNSCTGYAKSCSSATSSYSCSDISGCTWDSADCWGSPKSCGHMTTQATCASQLGCTWN